MKKDVFADWLREFCMLVFIQTIQAFLFAIVMSLIISLMSSELGAGNDVVGATGVIAVIVLASVSKMEEIVKKIFGIKSGFHDSGMRGGLKSLATTMMAANLAKGVLDNGRKMLGGAAGMVSAPIAARRESNQARARLARDLARYNKPPQVGAAGGGGSLGPTSSDYYKRALDAKKNNDIAGYNRNMGIAAGMNKAQTGGASTSSSDKMQDKIDAYNDKIAEIKANRNKQIRNSAIRTASGLAETVGAIGGAAVGMTAGAALGEGKEILQGGLAGAGIGDKVGSFATKPIKASFDIGSVITQNKKAEEAMIKEVNNMTAQAKEAINERNTRIRTAHKAKKELNRQLENLDAGNID